MSQPAPLTVVQFLELLRADVEGRFHSVRILGEVSQVKRYPSGHVYFTLKDDKASMSCVMWRSTADRSGVPGDGDKIEVAGRATVWPVRGQLQLDVRSWQAAGLGHLDKKLRELKARLEAEGLFDHERKKPLPFLPERVALVTSPVGAARHDMEKSLRDRFPFVRLVLVPTAVQGAQAAPDIARALRRAARIPGVDVIVCGRGGGSIEDLWAFNEEVVVRAIAASPLPVVSAVGHEIDVTLADLAASARALTPTAVGALVVPIWDELMAQLDDESERLKRALRAPITNLRHRLDLTSLSQAWRRPWEILDEIRSGFQETQQVLSQQIKGHVMVVRQRMETEGSRLEALSPLGVLGRGYAVVTDSRGRLARAKTSRRGDALRIQLADGSMEAVVEATYNRPQS
ncbi:MAG: exodeoxyribonuclease VII large subunit [Planctomycetota bacterium]